VPATPRPRNKSDQRSKTANLGEDTNQKNAGALGHHVQNHPVAALAEAGAHVDTAADCHGNVIIDRELVIGQQPMSAAEFAEVLLKNPANA